MSVFSENLKELREQKELSMRALAEKFKLAMRQFANGKTAKTNRKRLI